MPKIKINKAVNEEETEQVEQEVAVQKKKKKRKKEEKSIDAIDAHSSAKNIDVMKISEANTIKKSKKRLVTNEHADLIIPVDPIVKIKRSKRSNNDLTHDFDKSDPIEHQVDVKITKKKKNKEKHKCVKNTDDQSSTPSEKVSNLKLSKKSKKKQAGTLISIEPDVSKKLAKNKEILFENDTLQDKASCSENKTEIKKKAFLNDDEADVKDEDIDKFCDEVEDDDNEMYENWVKLIEAKLRSNVKKGK